MGTINSCITKCTKRESDEPEMPSEKTETSEIVSIMPDQQIKEEEENYSKKPIQIFKNQIISGPFNKYKIIKEISSNKKKVCLIDKSDTIRLMEIIPSKEIINNKIKNKSFLRDAEDLQLIDNSNILKLYEVYTYNENYYLICDYYEEDNLGEKIKNGIVYEESVIKIIMEQILNSILYLHKIAISNIGLKLDNIFLIEKTKKHSHKRKLLDNNDENDKEEEKENEIIKKYDIKISIIDYLKEKYELSDINTLVFYPPEIIQKLEQNKIIKRDYTKGNEHLEYDNKNTYDEWACGIVMYYLICGESPFKGESKEEIFSAIKNTNIDFSSPKFNSYSKFCIELLSKLLEKDRKKRIKCDDCINHPFFTGKEDEGFDIDKLEEAEEIEKESIENLLNVQKPRTKFHEIIIAYLCLNFLDKEEENYLNSLFKYIDKDHSNLISEQNIKDTFDEFNIKYTDEQIQNILYVFDYDKNNLIQNQEFLRVLCNKEKLFKEDNIKSVFNTITDNNQFITVENIQQFVDIDEKRKNKVKEEFIEPFGMKPEDKMDYYQFYEIIILDKIYPEVNIPQEKEKKPKKTKKKKFDIDKMKDFLKKNIEQSNNEQQ